MWRAIFLFPLVLFAKWAEKTLSEMTLEQKVGQLFVLPGCPIRGEDHWADWERLLDELHIGGVLATQADSQSQIHFLNALQKRSKLPLLVAADDEWGLGMRMSDAIAFPKNGLIGELLLEGKEILRSDKGRQVPCRNQIDSSALELPVQNRELLYELGQEIGRQARRVGVHLNLAPVADVNNNPKNPVIGLRSFGDDPKMVSECVVKVIEGMQSENTLACVKHFPGHGDTEVDSHWVLPILEHSWQRLEEIELAPFQKAIEKGVDVVMVGHLLVPVIDAKWPATLSFACVHSLLKEKMGFSGLIITDALNMQALGRYSPEEIAFLARKAGCDLLLYGWDPPPMIDWIMRDHIFRAHRALVEAYRQGELKIEELDRSVLKILQAKEKLGLDQETTVPLEGVEEFLWREAAVELQEKLNLSF